MLAVSHFKYAFDIRLSFRLRHVRDDRTIRAAYMNLKNAEFRVKSATTKNENASLNELRYDLS